MEKRFRRSQGQDDRTGGSKNASHSGGPNLATKRQIDLKNEDGVDALGTAKDRGQVTMTSAMSMTNITLLKAVLDRGPDHNRFYLLLIILTTTALTLQILAGIISLCVSQLKNYYQKFNDNARPRAQCCPLSVSWGGRGGTGTSCCPCMMSRVYSHYESNMMEQWSEWAEQDTQHDMNSAEADIMIEYLDTVIEKSSDNLERLRQTKADQESVGNSNLKTLTDKIDLAYRKKLWYLNMKAESEGSTAKGDILSAAMHDIVRNNTLKRAQTWQYIINLMLYCAFIISAFLSGLGLAT